MSDATTGKCRCRFANRWWSLVCLVVFLALGACSGSPVLPPVLQPAAEARDALALSDGLEALIDQGAATEGDRQAAYNAVRSWSEPTASYAFARASLAGRLAQVKRLSGKRLVAEMERYARRSIALDRNFRRGAARRMLGTLYVLAPGPLLAHGDSEEGLELLEEVLEEYPEDLENHLRVAEGYVHLNDPEPAYEALCRCWREREQLRSEDRRLLDKLLDEVGGLQEIECEP